MTLIHHSKTSDRRGFTLKMLEIFKDRLEKVENILIKPNIVSHESYPTTTHPEILDTLLTKLQAHQILVADGPAVDTRGGIIKNHDLKKVCDYHEVPILDLRKQEFVSVKSSRGFKLRISKIPLKANFVISLPVLKVHSVCGMTCALKMQFGYLSNRERILAHMRLKNIHKVIAELNVLTKPSFFIVDAIKTLIKAQERRHGGVEADLGSMFAGEDPVSLDCFGFELLKDLVDMKEFPEYIKLAREYGVGRMDFELKEVF
ncbi:MAG: DUF362 domain-containing protein [Candidatus Methanofastidiosia archaeon]